MSLANITSKIGSHSVVSSVARSVACTPTKEEMVTIDGNNAAAHVAYHMSEMAILFPITPATPMGELADAWAVKGSKNIFGQATKIHQMQSEGGVAGALHGALLGGSMSCTFTSSQGLLLMIPNMYKISGELLPGVIHIATRNLGTHSQCIYPEHSDLIAIRSTGWPILYSSNVQECQDLALVSHLATVDASLPFVHAFDGFRTSHELSKISQIHPDTMRSLINEEAIAAFRDRAVNPNHPTIFGTIASDMTSFQATEALVPYHARVPEIVEEMMEKVYSVTGRRYHLFDYHGHPEAEHVIIIMGSGAGVTKEGVDYLLKKGEKVGVVNVHLFRPFSASHLLQAIPKTVKTISVMERVREQTSAEPLYLDVVEAVANSEDTIGRKINARVFNGIYGLSGFPFTPSHIIPIFDNAKEKKPRVHFTVGIVDDVMGNSLPLPTENIDAVPEGTVQCMFYGLGSDGTVGANKEAITLIADFQKQWDEYIAEHPDETRIPQGNKVPNYVPGKTFGDYDRPLFAQGYFAYDAKKSGGLTISHLRFGPRPIESQYAIDNADYIACSLPSYVAKYDMLQNLKPKGKFVINSSWGTLEECEKHLPSRTKRQLAQKNAELYTVDAFQIAKELGLGQRTNMIMQTVFYGLSNVLPLDATLKLLKESIEKQYGRKGGEIVGKNFAAVDMALSHLHRIEVPSHWAQLEDDPVEIDLEKPEFVRDWMEVVERQDGTKLKVSEQIIGAGMPSMTTRYEKRSIAVAVPHWDKDKCVQCGLCSIACPHAALRAFLLNKDELKAAPSGYESVKARGRSVKDYAFSIQISPADCMSCKLCATVCPAGALTMVPREEEEWKQPAFDYSYDKIPGRGDLFGKYTVKGAALQTPLLEFHGACPGCGESPYVELLTRLYGERLTIAQASGCAVVWMGTQGWGPFAVNEHGKGPAFANSLFEDNAEFGFGLAVAHQARRGALLTRVEEIISRSESKRLAVPIEVVDALKEWIATYKNGEANKVASDRVEDLLRTAPIATHLRSLRDSDIEYLLSNTDSLVKQAIWIVGGDGWAYDIGFGGLDHVLASGLDVNVMILDTNVYSNTGGQKSKATPISAVAKFAAGGNVNPPKDISRIFMTYGNIYVGNVSLGYDPAHTLQVIQEAETYDGPSLVVAYCPCINQGPRSGMSSSFEQEKLAVETGMWPLFRFDPRKGDKPFTLDSPAPSRPSSDLLDTEVRFTTLGLVNPEEAMRQRALYDAFNTKKYASYKSMEDSQPK